MKLYDRVQLADGREGDIIEILNNGEAYLIEITKPPKPIHDEHVARPDELTFLHRMETV